MSYFKEFPLFYYTNADDENYKLCVDILRRVKIRDKVKSEKSTYLEYTIKDGDNPESISRKLYGSENYFWIVLMMNDMLDPFYDWPLSQQNLEKFITKKYGSGNEDDHHHYEFDDGTIGDDPALNADQYEGVPVSISNRTYEDDVNEAKRNIKILHPDYFAEMVVEMKKKIK